MSYLLGEALFQSAARSSVLEHLFVRKESASVSELARRAGLSARAVGNEVRLLLPTGLVEVQTVGGADIVRGNLRHPASSHLQALLQIPALAAVDGAQTQKLRESLSAWGAPLAGVEPHRTFSLHETLLQGLEQAKSDGTILRVLPTVLAVNLQDIEWVGLKEDARRKKLKAELGFLLELTGKLLGEAELKKRAADLEDRRRRTLRFFPRAGSPFEQKLAKQRSSELAKRWGFWMNLSEESFKSTLQRHLA